MLDILGSLIGKGLDFFSSKSNTDKNNQTQLAINAQNVALQKEFAQHGLSWKIDDAATKGIHPLVALGAQSQSFTPQTVGLETPKSDFGGMGQDIGRALKAALSGEDREKADEAEARKLTLEKGRLENDILRTDLISRVNRTSRGAGQLGPPMPSTIARSDVRVPLPRSGPARTVSGLAVGEDVVKQASDDIPAQAVVRAGGIPLSTNPYFSDAEKATNRYGEHLGDILFGPANLFGDLAYTGYKFLPQSWQGAVSHRPSAHEKRWRRRY